MPTIIKSPNNKPKPSKKKFLIYFAAVITLAAIITVGVVYGYVEPRKRRIKECQNSLTITGLTCVSACTKEENKCTKNCDEDDYKCSLACYKSNDNCKKECSNVLLKEAVKCDNM
ncbi:hypothetical protein CONCODRAFT_80786 [Conidiobolus coronatus NRRL 28638]|uniref:Uncharacterized protein n=1 Tax=Conidiobolus coronatus (strain ATCC 28846 / CBS 209.66 / NRRL 28638) TaxID=796925 RepID=A0A137NRI0_CONC2|nr:hypothetical protein CONCODRAFT_80786 [Conidiobolus coronatus NRRL 28638]|eukprot:KXN65351.1 hypothetical protein CONCODRAFT_80786 [Conidiobolus coronatus NRRL 28638]